MEMSKFNLEELSMDELSELYVAIEKVFYRKQKELQEVCEHPEVVDIMHHNRVGAFYQGCKVCQKNMTDYSKLTWTYNDSN